LIRTTTLPATHRGVPESAREFVVGSGGTLRHRRTGLPVVTVVRGEILPTPTYADAWAATVAEMAALTACSDLAVAEQYLVDYLLTEAEVSRRLRQALRHGEVAYRRAGELDDEAWIFDGAPFSTYAASVGRPTARILDRTVALLRREDRLVWDGRCWRMGEVMSGASDRASVA
jgi:hypothetical protein